MNAPADCPRCPRLCASRKAVVNGFGPEDARIVVVGQGPGRIEEKRLRPFCGWSGDRIEYLLGLAGIDPDTVRLENITRCRTPRGKGGDLPPRPEEIAACREFLLAGLTRAEVVIAVGAPALRWFFPKESIANVHGRALTWTHSNGNTLTVFPVYHPAAAHPSRNPSQVTVQIEDWRQIGEVLREGAAADHREYVLLDEAGLKDIIARAEVLSFDYETEKASNLWQGTFQPVRAKLIGVAVSANGESAGYYPCTEIPSALKAVLSDPTRPKVAHNTIYEEIVSRTHGVVLHNVHDTKQMASVLRTSTTWLKGLAWIHLGLDQTQFDSVDWEDLESVVPYASADAALTHTLFTQLGAALREEGLWDLYEAERACIAPLAEMTLRGIKLDLAPIVALRAQLTEEQRGLEAEIKATLGEINLNSGTQLARALYGPSRPTYTIVRTLAGRRMHDVDCPRKGCIEISCTFVRTGAMTYLHWWAPGLAWPVKARTDGGLPATDMNTLRLYEDEDVRGNAIIAPLVRYKSAQRLLRNELTRWPELIQEDGRIHPAFHLSGHFEEHGQGAEAPMTGRMSSSAPNWQNVTHHGDDARPYVVEWASQLRRAVVPREGLTLWKGDIGQEEPRIGAMISEDWALLEEIDTGDVYREVAGQAFGLPAGEITREQRQIGKRNWMAWLNGAGPSGIQQAAFWLSNDKAMDVVRFLQDRHPLVEAVRARLVEHLYDTGYTETWFGRRIYRPAIWSGPGPARNHAERSVMPDKIQGTAADVMKRWLPRVELPANSYALMTIHDEIVGEAPGAEIPATHQALMAALLGILPIKLPLEFEIGPNWSDTEVVDA